jgi:hypothetical protein
MAFLPVFIEAHEKVRQELGLVWNEKLVNSVAE